MFGFRYLFLCGVLAINLTSIYGITDEELGAISTILLPFMMECGKEFGVTKAEFKAARAAGTLQHLKPCFLSCVFKKLGLLNSKGMFDEEKANVLATALLSEEKPTAVKIINTCKSVNDKTVADGDKGCERATILYECYMSLKGALPGAP